MPRPSRQNRIPCRILTPLRGLALVAALCGFGGVVGGTGGGHAFAQMTSLVNPVEKHFADSIDQSGNTRGNFAKGALFKDDMPSPSASKTGKTNRNVRQVSAESEIEAKKTSVWDSLANDTETDNTKEMTLADWGVPPGVFPPSAQTQPAMTNGYTPQQNSFFTQENTAFTPAVGFSAGLDPNNAFAFQNGMFQQGMMQHGMTQGGYAADPYAYYAQNGGLYTAGPYDGASMYDSYGMMEAYQSPARQQLALYQAMLQQEAIRREVEAEIEQEEAEEKLRKKAEDEGKSPLKNDAKWNMNQLMPVHVSSPLGKSLLSCAKTLSPFNSPKGPHRGVGQPLEVRSWLDRPWYFGGFTGWISGSELVDGLIDQKSGAMGGLILGYNLSEYWGLESRVHFTSIDIRETARGRLEYEASFMAAYPDVTFVPLLTTRTNRLSVFDVSVHYYPLGNAKWRPYFKYGLGLARESFVDTFGQKYREDTMTMPLGLGLRYWWTENLAIQADLVDNVVFSSGIAKTQNNWAFCVGLTYSFGSSKKNWPTTYWPFTPSQGSKW